MNWNRRYAIAKKAIPSDCVFCGDTNHLLHTARGPKLWSKENRETTGLPRPYSDSAGERPHPNKKINLREPITLENLTRQRYPVPWAAEPQWDEYGGDPVPSYKHVTRAITEERCPMCGEKFADDEPAERWVGYKNNMPSSAESDIFPAHPECMRQIKIFCPAMRNEKPENFETGPYKELRQKALDAWMNLDL